MAEQTRHSFSNAVIDQMISNHWAKTMEEFTRDVPSRVQHQILGEDVTVAKESDRGRGAPLVDLYGKVSIAPFVFDEVVISCKITSESGRDRARNVPITTGTEQHIEAIRSKLDSGIRLPMIVAHQNKTTGQWQQISFDLGATIKAAIVAGHIWQKATGVRGKVLVYNKRRQTYKGSTGIKVYEYTTLRLNLGPAIKAGLIPNWIAVDFPEIRWE